MSKERDQSSGSIHFLRIHDRSSGLDAIRLFAAIAVFYQHACTLLDHDEWAIVEGTRIGRLGTALFLGLSGYLAASTSRSPERWLWDRFRKIFPAYWVVLTLSFLAVLITGYKSFDAWQFVCQFMGIGLFTHQGQLINVTTWFVSALLVLYLVAYLGMRTHGIAVLLATAAALAIGIERSSTFETVAVHSVTFLAAYSVGRLGWPPSLGFMTMAFLLALLSTSTPEFRYGSLALLGMAAAAPWTGEFRTGQVFATISFEWFLVHGLCLHVTLRFLGHQPIAVFTVAATGSVIIAICLRQFIQRAGKILPYISSHHLSFRLHNDGQRRIIHSPAET